MPAGEVHGHCAAGGPGAPRLFLAAPKSWCRTARVGGFDSDSRTAEALDSDVIGELKPGLRRGLVPWFPASQFLGLAGDGSLLAWKPFSCWFSRWVSFYPTKSCFGFKRKTKGQPHQFLVGHQLLF